MFIKIKRRKLRYEIAIDVMLLESYRDSGTSVPKHRFVQQWTIRNSDWKKLNRRQWFFEDVEYDLTGLVPDNEQRQKILASIDPKCSEYMM